MALVLNSFVTCTLQRNIFLFLFQMLFEMPIAHFLLA